MDDYSKIIKEFTLFYFFEKYRESLIKRYSNLSKKQKIKIIKSRLEFRNLPKSIQILIIKSIK